MSRKTLGRSLRDPEPHNLYPSVDPHFRPGYERSQARSLRFSGICGPLREPLKNAIKRPKSRLYAPFSSLRAISATGSNLDQNPPPGYKRASATGFRPRGAASKDRPGLRNEKTRVHSASSDPSSPFATRKEPDSRLHPAKNPFATRETPGFSTPPSASTPKATPSAVSRPRKVAFSHASHGTVTLGT